MLQMQDYKLTFLHGFCTSNHNTKEIIGGQSNFCLQLVAFQGLTRARQVKSVFWLQSQDIVLQKSFWSGSGLIICRLTSYDVHN